MGMSVVRKCNGREGHRWNHRQSQQQQQHRPRRKQLVNPRFPCGFCPQVFTFRSLLLRHERMHTGERPFECNLCGMTFRMKHHLVSHVARHRIPVNS
ncbi:hypothetical protein MTO96_018816 [Rhipicephalus appendiculatus]